MERDPEAASAEYIAQLLSDLGKIIMRKVVGAQLQPNPMISPMRIKEGTTEVAPTPMVR